jgi:putative acetyltransferase
MITITDTKIIRRATKQDGPAICGLLDAVFTRTLESKLYDLVVRYGSDYCDWVCEKDSRVAGYVLYTTAMKGAEPIGFHLGPVAVHPDFQNQGIGSELIERTLHEEPVKSAAVFVLGHPNFYERFGFSKVITARCFFDGGNEHFRALRWAEAEQPFEIGYSQAFADIW